MNLQPFPVAAGFAMPADACDAHCHVFGPAAVFPYAPDSPYIPADASKEDLAALHRRFAISRTVIVQPVCHGRDHRALLDAIAADPERRRGVAILGDDADAAEVARLHAGGVRGVRFNFVGHLGGAPDPAAIERIVALIRPFGWHVAVHIEGKDLAAREALFRLPVPVVVDHMARLRAADGPSQKPLRDLLGILDRGTAWVKLSGADRISSDGAGSFEDAVPIARALVEAAPDRVLWGTDWPHPNVSAVPDDADLVALIERIAPTADLRHRLLVANPARLYGFPPSEDS